jgi:hypothetical protein
VHQSRELADEVIEAYVDWRDGGAAASRAYERWTCAPADLSMARELVLSAFPRGGWKLEEDPRVPGWRTLALEISQAEVQPVGAETNPEVRRRL